MMGSHDASAAPGLSGPDEGVQGAGTEEPFTDHAGSDTPLRESEADGIPVSLLAGEPGAELLADPVREVDRRNGNASRARRQALKEPEMVEDEAGNVHHVKAVSLAIPEEKRCQALTVHGVRCKAGKMRGMEVCVFHSHRALSDDALATIADKNGVEPRLTPRKALKAVVALRAGELAEAAVGGALAAEGANRTRAVLALVDAVDPLVTEEGSITLSREGAATATWSQMRQIFNPTG